MNIKPKIIYIIFALTLSITNIFATNYYVNPSTGNDLDDGLTSVNAKATLQDIFDSYNLGTGDIIYCETGTYSQDDIRPGSDDEGFTIQGDGEGLTIFSGSSSDGWLYLSNSNHDNIKIYDITVQNYKQAWGGGLYSTEAITGTTFTDVTFDNCDATSGGGGFVISNTDNQSLTVSNCTFKNCDGTGYDDDFGAYYVNATGTFDFTSCTFHTNHGYDGGALGIYDGTNTFDKCTFYNNDADDDGAVLYCIDGTYTFENCLFYENSAGSGEVIYSGSSSTCEIRHCTIVDNTTYGVSHTYAGTLNIYSCIIQDNTSSDIYTSSATLNVYNTIYNTSGGWSFDVDSNNETTDATFTDKANDDYTLNSSSNGIDEGYVSGAPSDDLAGNTRDATPDMGCYEAASNEWTGATSSAWTTTTNWSLGTVPTSSDSPTIPNVATQPEITSTVTLAGLTIASGADLTVTSNSLTVTGTFDNNGTLYIDNATVNADDAFDATGGTIDFTNASGTLVLSSTVTSLGTVDAAMGTVEYDGGTQTVAADSYYNLTISTAGTKTAGGAIDVNGDFSTAATATCELDMTTYDLNVAGNLTVGATDGLDLSDASALLTLDGSGTQTVTHAGTSSGSGTTTLLTETFDNTWSSLEKPTASWSSDVASSSSQAWHRNNVTTNWSYTSSGSPSTYGYTGGSSDYYARFHTYGIYSSNNTYIQTPSVDLSSYSPGSVTFYYINPTGTDVLEVYFYDGSSWVKQGSSYGTQASWTQKTIAVTGAYLHSSFAVRFKATSDYGNDDIGIDQVVISGDYSNSGAEATDFTINKSGGDIILSSEFTVDGTLTLTSGDIDASANNLLLTDNATISGSSDASHVIGTIVKTIASDAPHVLPLGDGTALRKVTIDPNDATSRDWTVSLTNSAYGDLTTTGSITYVSGSFYWDISPTTSPASTDVTLAWESAIGIQDADLTNIKVAHFNGTDWEEITTTTSGTPTTGSVSGSVTSFSPFTIGTVGASPLPVSLTKFNGYAYNDYDNKLEWETMTEKNADYMEIQHSDDGIYFDVIGIVKLAGNSQSELFYEFIDRSVSKQINYYRLKQFDFDGKSTLTKTISIDNRSSDAKQILRITNLIGQEIDKNYKGVVIIQYSDGSSEKRIQ